MRKDELRPCMVNIAEKTIPVRSKDGHAQRKVIKEAETHNGYFHIWGFDAYTTVGYMAGTAPGQVSTLYGVVEYEDGTVHRVPPECITFTDR